MTHYAGKRDAPKSPASSLPLGAAAQRDDLNPDVDELQHILGQTQNDMGRVDWLKVLSVCSGYEGGEELALDWSKGGEYAAKFVADGWHKDWAEGCGFNGGVPMHIGVLVKISQDHNRNADGYKGYRKPTYGSNDQTNGSISGDKLDANEKLLDASALPLGELPSVAELLKAIEEKAATHQGAWLAHAVLSADEGRINEYQRKYPTTSKETARSLVDTNGKVAWEVATWTAAMHIAGEVLLLQPNHDVRAVKELNKEDAEKVIALTLELFKACPIEKTWANIPTTKNLNMHNTVVSAAWKAAIVSKGGAAKTDQAFVSPPAQPSVAPANHPAQTGGTIPAFGLLGARPEHLGGKAGVTAPNPALGKGAVVGEVVGEVPLIIPPPVTLGNVGSLPPKRERADKTPPLELLKAAMLAEKKGKWFTCKTTREIYTLTDGGWYEHVAAGDAETEVAIIKEREGINIGSLNAVKDAVRLLQMILPAVEFCTVPHLIPMRNGVLDSTTRVLHPYGTMLPFNWHIPHDYTDAESCDVWEGFIAKQLGGDEGRTKTLKAFLRCMVGGAYQAQKYLEIVGTGGAGKSQLMTICVALMGEANTVQSSLSALDGKDGTSRFETSNLYGKKLVTMPDQEKFFGASSNFRCITGNDHVRNEKKNVQAGNSFVFQGFVIITANQFMNPKNNGSAILRRRVPMLFDVMASDEEKARYPDGIGQHIIDHELAGVLNWVLAMPLTEARAQLRKPDAFTVRLNNDVEDGNNPVRAWLRDEVVSCGRGEETMVGSDIRDVVAKCSPDWGMYADYCHYCRGAGNVPMNRKGFTDSVLNEMRGKGVELIKERTRNANYNKTILSGLRLRKGSDD